MDQTSSLHLVSCWFLNCCLLQKWQVPLDYTPPRRNEKCWHDVDTGSLYIFWSYRHFMRVHWLFWSHQYPEENLLQQKLHFLRIIGVPVRCDHWPFLWTRAPCFYLLRAGKWKSGQFKFDLKLPWYCLILWMGFFAFFPIGECGCLCVSLLLLGAVCCPWHSLEWGGRFIKEPHTIAFYRILSCRRKRNMLILTWCIY